MSVRAVEIFPSRPACESGRGRGFTQQSTASVEARIWPAASAEMAVEGLGVISLIRHQCRLSEAALPWAQAVAAIP